MQPEGAQPDRPVLAVRVLSLQHLNVVDVDDVIEHPCLNRNESIQYASRYGTGKVDRVQVADNEIARDFGNHDASLSVLRNKLFLFNNSW
ncbi:hypothetical protein D3C77_414720 [compost metagenome]